MPGPAALSDPCGMLGPVQTQSVSPVFVGRAAELTALETALARATAGEPQAVLVGGEAGVGKTRLVEEFLSGACRSGAVVAVGGCVEVGADGLPFAPVATALRALHRRLGDELARAAAGQEGELARLLPELGETTREAHDQEGRARLFELTARLLERLAAERTLILAIEDLHWADSSTRELLAYLFRSLDAARLVIVATYRSDDIHRRHPLRPFLAELDRMRTVLRVELDRFNRDEVHAQITGIQGAPPDSALVDRVFARSEGNAFFVEELACSIAQGCRTGLSESLRDLLLVRVEALPPDAQRVARILAEGGSEVEYALLAKVTGLGEDDLIEALRGAVGANILLPTADGDGYRFRHALVREAVVDDLLPGERSRLNRRYAEALEADPALVRSAERAARLASYWYHAHDPAKALPAVLAAAVEARRRYAYAEQLRLLERALELWEEAPRELRESQDPFDYGLDVYPACGGADEGPSFTDLLAETVVAAYLAGRRERSLAISKRALRLLDDGRDPLRAAWFWTQRSRVMEGLGRGDGWAELSRAQELVRGLPPSAVHAEVLALVAGWGMIHQPGPDAYATAERAVELARLVGAEGIELHARLTLGTLMVDSGDVEGGLAEMAAVCARVVELGTVSVLGRCHVNYASALESVGRSAQAVEVATEGIAVHKRFGLVESLAWAYSNKADSLFALGRWDEAEEFATKAMRLATNVMPRASVHFLLADIAFGRGELDRAEAQLAALREDEEKNGTRPEHAVWSSRLAIALAGARGRIAQARETLGRVVERGFPSGGHRYAWPLLLAAATAEADARGLPGAEEGRDAVLRRIAKAARALPQPVALWRAYGLLVEAELRRADGRDRVADWAAAAAAFEPLERPHLLATARHHWARALLADDQAARDLAGRLLAQAHESAERLGARPLREAVELLARRARLPLGRIPQAPAEDLGLTPRERDVLRLVAAGHSNRRIAEELFISPKTASVHVSNILAKLGVSGRGEAAALAHRLALFPDVERAAAG
nr:LuxR family transcriptional regulator [Streptomyces sp. ICBB 8177]